MAIRYFSEDVKFKILNKRQLSGWLQFIIIKYNRGVGDINFIYTSNYHIQTINREYLNHNYFTDIITFNYNENSFISGDIYISIDTVQENALYYNTTFLDELYRVMVHGVLHLLGFNDSNNEEEKQMKELENSALSELYTKFLPNK